MNKDNKTKRVNQTDKKIDLSTHENKNVKNSLDSNYNLDLLENTNAYYSERYGWTLKRNS